MFAAALDDHTCRVFLHAILQQITYITLCYKSYRTSRRADGQEKILVSEEKLLPELDIMPECCQLIESIPPNDQS